MVVSPARIPEGIYLSPIVDAPGHFPQAFWTFNPRSVLRLTKETVVCNVLLVIENLTLLFVLLRQLVSRGYIKNSGFSTTSTMTS
jgi:hypothetical protein